jgi:uncharacterized protein (TIGR02145 family)
MKKLFTLFVIIAFTISVFAQSPQKMSYQAVVRNITGVLMANQSVGMKISILQGSTTGTPVYVETQTASTNANGLVTLEIGGGTPSAGTFSGIDWSSGTYFIKTETDPAGGTNYTITGVSQILSVPYALYSKTAKTANYNDLTNKPVLFDGSWSGITDKPNTLDGYGIQDAVRTTGDQEIRGIKSFKGTTPNMEQALFEIKNQNGQTIFAVYNEGVRMWVSDGAKGTKGGFAVQGFDMKTDYMVIKPDSANFYVREATTKGVASSFNIIGVKQNLARKSLMFARPDTVAVSGVMNLRDNLLIAGNLNIAGTIITKITDVEGNNYNIVTIGTQTWMAENLKTTKYNDGTNIPLVTNGTTWGTLTTPAYCWYNNDEAGNKITYGALYNWYTVNSGKLCPSGWHIPDNSEWTTLTDYLGGQSIAGGKLKETGTAHWTTPNTGATDEVFFTGLPAGSRGGAGVFGNIGNYGYWWTANAHSVDPLYAWGFVLQYNLPEVIRADYYYKRDGFSVRCIKN